MNRLTRIGIGLVVLLSLAAVAIPNLLSTDFVKSRIEAQLSDMTGHRVSLRGDSSISLSPYLGVVYNMVVVRSRSGSASDAPLMIVDGLKAKLSPLAILAGEISVSRMHLVRPQINLVIQSSGRRNWTPTLGPLVDISKNADDIPAPSLALSDIYIEDGIARIVDERSQSSQTLTSINGEFNWGNINAAADADISAVWRGEVVTIKASAQSPLNLLLGQSSATEIAVSSKPIQASYAGDLMVMDAFQSSGAIKLNVPSPTRLADWMGLTIGVVKTFPETELAGAVTVKSGTLEMPEATVRIAEHTGSGRLGLSVSEQGRPSVRGTLAFDDVEFTGLSNATDPSERGPDSPFQTSSLSELDLDLRLSAKRASVSAIEVQDLAATALIRNGEGRFEIGHALTLDGKIAASMTVKPSDEANPSNTMIIGDAVLSDIDLSQLSSLLGKGALSMNGKGSTSIQLKAVGKTYLDLLSRLNGTGTLTGENGALVGIDLQRIMTDVLSAKSTRSAIKLNGSTPFSNLQLAFHIANGTAFFKDSSIVSDTLRIELWGQSDLLHRSLALRGRVTPSSSAISLEDSRSVSFFVGGNISAPLFVPLSVSPQAINN